MAQQDISSINPAGRFQRIHENFTELYVAVGSIGAFTATASATLAAHHAFIATASTTLASHTAFIATASTTLTAVADFVSTASATLASHTTFIASASATLALLGTAAFKNTGTSGNTVPLLDGANTWGAQQIFSDKLLFGATAGVTMTGSVNPKLQVFGAGTAGAMGAVRETTPGAGGALCALASSRGTPSTGSFSAVQTNDGLGSFVFGGDDGTDINQQAAGVGAKAEANFTSGSSPGRLEFATTPTGSNSTVIALTIDSTQKSIFSGVLKLKSYTVATLPTGVAGDMVFATDCRVFNGAGTQEGAGTGTGGVVSHNGTAWKIAGTNVTAVA